MTLAACAVLGAAVVAVVIFREPLAELRADAAASPGPAVRDVVAWSVLVSFGYLVAIYATDLLLVLFAWLDNAIRTREVRTENFEAISASRFTIPVSVLVPMHNEEAVLGPVVRALLALDYPEYEVIVVNDGSSDGTLARLKRDFDLRPIERFYRRVVDTSPVRALYRSARDPRLIVADKEWGGTKADALNCGLNLARFRYVWAVDGDTMYSRDALLKGMRLVLRDPGTIVGVTSQISVASRPEEHEGEAAGEVIDRTLLSNFQHIEYLRAFLNDRLAWSRLDFMLCTSGAYMLYRRDVLEEVGGWSKDFSCEDIELTFRVHEHFLRGRKPYRILALPDMTAKTEGPDRIASLVAQRVRWQRVIMETVWHYRRMTFNPRYQRIGMLGLPFFLLSEVLASFVEVLAIISLAVAWFFGLFSWGEYVLVLGIMSFANAVLTSGAILMGDVNDRTVRLRHLLRLLLLGPLELIVYRPTLMWARAKGTWGFFRGERGWGKFERNIRPGEVAPGRDLSLESSFR